MIDINQAWDLVHSHIGPLPREDVDITGALNCVLAEPVFADRDSPAFDKSAMDGYAVRAADLSSTPTVLTVVAEVPAGSAENPEIGPGECVSIFTGANVPSDADTVVMIEDTELVSDENGDRGVRFLSTVKCGQHIRYRAENAAVGDELVSAGTLLGPAHISICASVGIVNPIVFRKPRVSIVTTGSELKNPGVTVAGHEIRDSNGPMLRAMVQQHQFVCVSERCAPDDVKELSEVLADELSKCDVLLTTGGVSVGKYDLIPEVVNRLGGKIIYHGVRIKPGKPQFFAAMPDNKYVFGLPGNPLSAITGMNELALPGLRRLTGLPVESCRPLIKLPLAMDLQTGGKRQNYLLGRIVVDGSRSCVEPIKCMGSGDLVAAGLAEGTIIVPFGAEFLSKNEMVDFRPWRSSV